MKRLFPVLIGAAALVCIALPAGAAQIGLFGGLISIDGVAYELKPNPVLLPTGVTMEKFDLITGLGTITVESTEPGSHRVGLFLDHEIDADDLLNTGYNDEFGTAVGKPPGGLSWEIDEPGYVPFGDIDLNFLKGVLDNQNSVPTAPNDVSLAMFWNFTLAAGGSSIVSFSAGQDPPTGGFYLSQTQTYPDNSVATIYMTSTLEGGTPIVTPVPEPGTLLLAGAGLLCMTLYGARRGRP